MSSSDSSKLVVIASSVALAAGALWFLSQDEREEAVVFDAEKHHVEALLEVLETVLHEVIIVHSEALNKLKSTLECKTLVEVEKLKELCQS